MRSMGYCKAIVVLTLILALVFEMGRLGSCSRAMYHMKSPHHYKFRKAAEVSSVDSYTVPVRNCSKLCRFNGFHTMLIKGPVPPSGPSHKHNSVPNDR